jgi:cobalt/nickel transport system permease protein
MHISEGVLSVPVLVGGAALTAAGTAVGLKKLDYERIAQAGMLSATFFVTSLIHVPIGPSSVHLILNGIVGLLLGWAAFPVILVALLLQAILFQYGGITSLGVNTVIMALPAVMVHFLFRRLIHKAPQVAWAAAFGCGSVAVLGGALLAGVALMFTEENFFEVSLLVISAHLPVTIIEGIVAGFFVAFIKKVQPSMLPGYRADSQKAIP